MAKTGNVVGLPIKKVRNTNLVQVFTCKCGGQLFVLCDNGVVICHSCRSKQTKARFKVTS